MNKKRIGAKLFIITTLFLALFSSGLLYAMKQFFGSYYVQNKQHQFSAQVRTLIDQIAEKPLSTAEVVSMFEEYMNRDGIIAALYPLDHGADLGMDNLKQAFSQAIVSSMNAEAVNAVFMTLQKVSAIKELPDQLAIDTMSPSGLGQQYLVGERKVTFQSRTYLFLALTSLQPVDEAVGMLDRSLGLVFAIALAASILLSTVISRLIARPLVRELEREQALDKLRREFIAGASHELKTPISIISGYSESLLDNIVAGAERTEYERVIHDEAQKMSKLVRGMLDVSLLQTTGKNPNRSEVSIDTVILRTLRHFGLMLKSKAIRVVTDGIYPVTLAADESQMDALFANLISNAISHTPPEGWIRIEFATIGNEVQISIENKGEPIPLEMMDRIWDPFFRVDTSHNRSEGRYGLGLSIVRGIVLGHGGGYRVQNTEHGVQFVIHLPRNLLLLRV